MNSPLFAKIGFQSHKITCIIGIHPHEREQVQDLFVDLEVKYDISKCVKSEEIEDTISYSELAQFCTKLATEKKYQLIETFAFEACEEILKKFPKIKKIKIKIKKPAAIKTAECAFVELEYPQ